MSFRAPILRSRSSGLLPICHSGSGSLTRFDSYAGGKYKRKSKGGALKVLLYVALFGLLGGAGYAVVRIGGRQAGVGGAGAATGHGLHPARSMREQREPQEPHLHLGGAQGHVEGGAAHQAEQQADWHAGHGHGQQQQQQHHEPHEPALHEHGSGHGHAGAHAEQQQQQQQGQDGHGQVHHDPEQQGPSLYDSGLNAVDIHGNVVHMADLRGKATVFVNVASKCGYTESNYRGLQAVYDRYHDHGLEILAFPSNEFGGQEPGSHAEIEAFAKGTYQATFTLMSKTEVNGAAAHPVWAWLKAHSPPLAGHPANEEIGWNFVKFLVDKWGHPVKRYSSELEYRDIELDVYNELIKAYP